MFNAIFCLSFVLFLIAAAFFLSFPIFIYLEILLLFCFAFNLLHIRDFIVSHTKRFVLFHFTSFHLFESERIRALMKSEQSTQNKNAHNNANDEFQFVYVSINHLSRKRLTMSQWERERKSAHQWQQTKSKREQQNNSEISRKKMRD